MLEKYFKNQSAFLIIIIGIILASLVSIFSLPIKMYPAISKPSFNFNFWHSEVRTPGDLYKSYGMELSEQISKLKGITEFHQSYRSGWGSFDITFDWGSDKEELEARIENIFSALEGRSANLFGYYNASSFHNSSGNMRIAISHDTFTTSELRDYLRSNLFRKIRQLENVEKIRMWGWSSTQPMIIIDRNKLLSYKINFASLLKKIQSSTTTFKAGEVGRDRNQRQFIYIQAEVPTLNDLNELIIFQNRENIVRIKDIATIGELHKGSESKIFRLNTHDANIMNIVLKSKGDVKKTCDTIHQLVLDFKKNNPGIDYRTIINPSTFINNAISNLIVNALFGGIVATLVILFFLGSFRNTIIIATSIPFCIIASFILMKMCGVSISIISLGGMAIGVGMIVDSSIVCLENIHRKLEHGSSRRISSILLSTKEVMMPIIASTLTSLVVFIPVLFTKSYTQAILGDLALTTIFILAISLFTALFFIPFLCFNFLSQSRFELPAQVSFIKKTPRLYLTLLNKIISRTNAPLIILISLTVLFISSLFLIPHIKKEIIGRPTTKLMQVQQTIFGNERKSITLKNIKLFENKLKSLPSIQNFSLASWNPNNIQYIIELDSRHNFKKVESTLKKAFPRTPDTKTEIYRWDPGGLPLPQSYDLELIISNDSPKRIDQFGDKIKDEVSKLKGWSHRIPWKSKNKNISLIFHPWVNKNDLYSLRKYINTGSNFGLYVSRMVDQGKIKWLHLRFKDGQRLDYSENLASFPILYQDKIVPLKAITKISPLTDHTLPIYISDDLLNQTMLLSFIGIKSKEKIAKIKAFIEDEKRSSKINVNYVEKNKDIVDSYESFKNSLIISIFLVFAIMIVFFNSFKFPLMILITIPFAITGAIAGLFITNSSISLNSMLGTILLCGLVVNNAILFIDFYRRRIKEGSSNHNAILEAAELRFRPILMTTLTTLFGIFPIALAIGESGEILQPLGISVFSGLLISTGLTLFVIPCLLALFCKKDHSLCANS